MVSMLEEAGSTSPSGTGWVAGANQWFFFGHPFHYPPVIIHHRNDPFDEHRAIHGACVPRATMKQNVSQLILGFTRSGAPHLGIPPVYGLIRVYPRHGRRASFVRGRSDPLVSHYQTAPTQYKVSPLSPAAGIGPLLAPIPRLRVGTCDQAYTARRGDPSAPNPPDSSPRGPRPPLGTRYTGHAAYFMPHIRCPASAGPF